jgi:catechol 2,3-dioxygenase-like lactoylglutathione lyase family enzyme
MTLVGLHHVTLIVDDMDKAAWFYGELLQLPANPRPDFDFPGLFYRVGSQQIHILVTPTMPPAGEMVLKFSDGSTGTRRYIHRHAAFITPDLPALKQRLQDNHIEILIDPAQVDPNDTLTKTMLAAWMRMYNQVPVFCLDPFGNLLELIPQQGA